LSLGRQESAEQTCKPARDSGIKIEKDRWTEGDEKRGAWDRNRTGTVLSTEGF
jgi:hypothetical protein